MKRFIKHSWWKVLCVVILIYVIIAGFTLRVPETEIQQTIRNIYFHVGMWFAMIVILFIGMINSVMFLRTNNPKNDQRALSMANTGLIFGLLGLVTGMIWAQHTWGNYWVNDPKLNGAAVGILAYLAYFILRLSIDDQEKKAKLAAVYNVFAFVMFFLFIMIIPRIASFSIHPGKEGNPALNPSDLDASMRVVFYPAAIGWILLSYWVAQIIYKLRNIKYRINKIENNI